MAHNILYNIFTSSAENFEQSVEELIKAAEQSDLKALRLVFFGRPESNIEYQNQRQYIKQRVLSIWGAESTPLITFVAQHPTHQSMALEVQMVGKEYAATMHFKELGGVRYVVSDRTTVKQLYTEGILASSLTDSMRSQSDEVLTKLEDILRKEELPINTIVRQWNYIEQITCITDDRQHYQDFNDSRSHFYAKTDWPEGYPAATGIGTDFGGIMVEVDIERLKNTPERIVPIDNPLQVAAHRYTQEVLIGEVDPQYLQRTTPKFERAKAVALYDCAKVYISGTAAIRGQESLRGVGIREQTVATIENIEYLISKKNLADHGVTVRNEPQVQMLRVYLKFEHDMEPSREIIEKKFPFIPALYVLTDVCRDELLIEIEGIAQC